MSEQQSIRDELAAATHAWRDHAIDGTPLGERPICNCYDYADYLLASPVIRRIQAEAIREATRVFATGGWVDTFTSGVVDDVSAVQATDRWFNERADHIEKGE